MASEAHVPFVEATKVERLDSHSYKVNLSEAYSIGAVPNGGYTASVMLAAAKEHLASRGHLDPLTAHFEYPARTAVGPAVVVIDDIKFAKNLCTLQLTLWQDGLTTQAPWYTPGTSRRAVIGFSTHFDVRNAEGISMPVGFEQTPAALLPEIPDLEALKANGGNERWEEHKMPKSSAKFTRSLRNWKFYLPRKEPLSPGVLDMWIRMTSGEKLTQEMLPYIVDSFPFNVHYYWATPEIRPMFAPPDSKKKEGGDGKQGEKKKSDDGDMRSNLWFPTVVMNLEAKSALPKEGVEWLACRMTCKQIKDGRFDIELTVRNLEGDIVALSNHVAMIVDMSKNTGKKGGSSPKASL